MTTAIRPVTYAGTGALASLSGGLGCPVHAAAIARRLEEIATDRAGGVRVAAADGRVVGWAGASLQRHLVDEARAELAGRVIAPGARHQGVDTELLRPVEGWAPGRGLGEVSVRSNVNRERAPRFCRREGCAETKRQVVFSRGL